METLPKMGAHTEEDSFLAGGGEMGRLMREHDWTSSRLGPVKYWSQSLRTAVSICLASQFPILIWWGSDFIKLYNDAYRNIIMEKHPKALGQPGQECWPEIWDIIGPMLNRVLTRGESTWSENQLLLLERNGFAEECYFTFSYSPIRDETGEVGGVFTAVTETTQQILGERRLRTLRALATNTAEAHSHDEVCSIAAHTISDNPSDMPFALFYLLSDDGQQAHLVDSVGLPAGTDATPEMVMLDSAEDIWLLSSVIHTGEQILLDNLAERVGQLHGYDASLIPPPQQALVLPMSKPAHPRPYGVLIAGLSSRRPLDEDYQSYCNLVAGQIATAINTVQTLQEERKRAEALAELDHAKTIFFSNISHEFRTPLTLLLGPLESVLSDPEGTLSETYLSQLDMAYRNAQRQLKLVNTLLDFSRIEAGRMGASYEPTDLAALTSDLASVFRSAIEKAGLRLVVDCLPLPESVYVDRQMWEKIVLNLLSNAFKCTFEGEIRVSLRAHDRVVELDISDTGIGIAQEDLPHLFERFYRVRNARSRSYEGSGIGLSLVQELVRLHGGTITVSSTLGQGTTFNVQLPLGLAHLPSDHIRREHLQSAITQGAGVYVQEALSWLPDAASGANFERNEELPEFAQPVLSSTETKRNESNVLPSHLLIVDDNADICNYLKHLLGPYFTLDVASDGVQALELARMAPPDLIISDVMMPGLDGFALLSALRADPRTCHIPVILLSARAGEEAVVEGLEAGADDYLVKPFSAREVLARVQARIEIARLQREVIKQKERTDEFLGMASHELKTPLTAIKGNTQLSRRQLKRILQALPLTSQELKNRLEGVELLVDRIERQANLQNRLISDMVDVSRIQAGKLELHTEKVDLVPIVREVVEYQRFTAPSRIILLEADADRVEVLADAGRIGQVVDNYLSNALKYSAEDRPVLVRLEVDKCQARVSVHDEGQGLSPSEQEHIWDRFYRVPGIEAQSGKGVGLGLGLHICQMILKQHGGNVGVESSKGEGSTFWFTLPFAETAE